MGELGSSQRATNRARNLIRWGFDDPNAGGRRLLPPPPVMASPPTFSTTGQGGATTFSTPKLYRCSSPVFRYLGCDFQIVSDAGSGLYLWGTNRWSAGHPYSSGVTVEFVTDAAWFELWLQNGVTFEVMVDGELTHATPRTDVPTTDGYKYPVKIDFGSRKPVGRLIRCRYVNQSWFGGVYVDRRDSVWGPRTSPGPHVALIGDSQVIGTGALAQYRSFGYTACRLLGWEDVWVVGTGGTGYANPGAQGYGTLGSHVADDIAAYPPDIIIATGSQNDSQLAYVGAVQANATALFRDLIARFPGVPLIVFGPMDPLGAPLTLAFQNRDAVKAAARAVGAPFIDSFGGTVVGDAQGPPRWFVGAGKAGVTTGVGNTDYYVYSDGSHFSDDGHAYLGSRLASEIATWFSAGRPKNAVIADGIVTVDGTVVYSRTA